MDPAMWSTLPKELLYLILAHLPLAHIFRLRILSKEWNWNVTARESEFRQVCSSMQSKIFGIICEGDPWGSFVLRFYDMRGRQWHILENTGKEYCWMDDKPCHTMGASDGGLVCWIGRLRNKEKNSFSILVCNPLIAKLHALPLPSDALRSVQPSMVKLVMDEDLKGYKVIAVGPTRHPGGAAVAEVYHSASDSWTSIESQAGYLFGEKYEWEDGFVMDYEISWLDVEKVAPCVFDCGAGKLVDLHDASFPCSGEFDVCHVILDDRLFVLHALGSVPQLEYDRGFRLCGPYVVTEYRGQETSPHWIKLREYRPSIDNMFTTPTEEYYMGLHACKGILLLTAESRDTHGRRDLAQLCDLLTGEWYNIPAAPRIVIDFNETMMCELRWDALP